MSLSVPFSDLWKFDKGLPRSISPAATTSNDRYLRPRATTVSPATTASSTAPTPLPPRMTMGRGASKTPNKSIRKRGEIFTKLIAKEWKRRTLIHDQSSQTEQVRVGFQTSDFGSQVNRSSATSVEVQIDMGARMHVWDVESQVNQNSPMNIREQADMGLRTAFSDFEPHSNLNSASYVEVMEVIELSVETPRR